MCTLSSDAFNVVSVMYTLCVAVGSQSVSVQSVKVPVSYCVVSTGIHITILWYIHN